ncbi:MAG TPA: F0F1 ATP synthase subunit B [bacterium]
MEFHVSVFILQFATFLLGLWASAVLFLPYLNRWMSDRQKRIESQLKTAETRQKEAEDLKTDLERKMKDLERSTSDILQKTREEAAKTSEVILQNSHKAAEQILSEARKAMESERQAAFLVLQKEVGALAVSIAEKIIRSSVDDKVRGKIVDESLKELGTRRN